MQCDGLAKDGDRRPAYRPGEVRPGPHGMPVLGDGNQVGVQHGHAVLASADILYSDIKRKYVLDMQLRYNYRLYPTAGQRSSLARAFGCARVVFNDALRLRQQAHQAGRPYLTDAEVSARL